MDDAAPRSGLFRAGEVMLLVGVILRVFMALFVLFFAAVIMSSLGLLGGGRLPAGFGIAAYLALGVFLGLTAIVGVVAWRKARAGEVHTSGILGIVAAMLPPVDVVFLLGGIFLLVCDEAKAGRR